MTTWGIFKTDSISESYKKMKDESLKGDQHKLDKNKNGKLDKHDFKLLRKEEVEQLDEAAVSTVAKAHGFEKVKTGFEKGSYKHPKTGETITALRGGSEYGHSRKDGSTVAAFKHKDSLEKHLASHGYKKESVNEDIKDYSLEELQEFMVSEDFEQLDELSKTTLGNYIKKAANDKADTAFHRGYSAYSNSDHKPYGEPMKNKVHAGQEKRNKGIKRAVNKLTRESVEQVEEGWDDMLKSVKDKNATQPNGGTGKKQGVRYGGGKQKDDEAQERKDKKNESVDLELLDDGTYYDGSDMLGEAQARTSSSFQFTHKPGDAESEKKLADLKAQHKGTNKRVVLQGRLGKDNPNAHKYSKDAPKATYANGKRTNVDQNAKSGAHSHQRIRKADAAHHDVYVYDKADTQYDFDSVITEAIHADDYHATSEPSQFGGHRPIVKHKEKGTVMYAGGKSYSTAAKAKEGAHAYLSAYEKRGPNAAMSAAHEHGKAHGMKKEGFELFNEKELDLLINEVLSKDSSAGKWISDFTKSDAPQFSGKSTEKRKQMALAAYYAAQKKESTDYESFLVLDEEKQPEIVKMGAKEIKHANMKDKQDDAEIMEPHSEGEANFIDQHYVDVTDDVTADKQDGGAGKLGKATGPKGQGAATYKGDSKLSDKDKASYKEGTNEEGDAISEKANCKEGSGKKGFSTFKAKVTG